MSFSALVELLESSLGIAYVDLFFVLYVAIWLIFMVVDQRVGSIIGFILAGAMFVVIVEFGMDGTKFLVAAFLCIVFMALQTYMTHKRGGGFVG